MAETKDKVVPQEDPLLKSSLAKHLILWSFLVLLFTGWAWYDEEFTKRPWRDYQATFKAAYNDILINAHVVQQGREEATYQGEEYARLKKIVDAEAAKNKDEFARLDARTALINEELHAINAVAKFPKGEIGALTYRIWEAESEGHKARLEAELKEVETVRKFTVELPQSDGTKKAIEHTYEEWMAATERLKAERITVAAERAAVDSVGSRARKALTKFIAMNMEGLETEAIVGLRKGLDTFVRGIKQVHVEDVGLVDRCQTCHLGALEPVPITREGLKRAGVTDEKLQTMFLSHPHPAPMSGDLDVLGIHPPAKFGCSPCHGGNGFGTTNAYLAHGKNKHWLWKLNERDDFEAGCLQCHEGSIHLDGSKTLNEGMQIFLERGCWNCHKREGFNRDADRLRLITDALKANRMAMDAKIKEGIELEKAEEVLESDEELDALFRRLDALKVEQSELTTEHDKLAEQQRDIYWELKRQGPNLKEIRAKLRPEWIQPWLADVQGFRPNTKMPQFRLDAKQISAISAFLWNRALDLDVPAQAKGDAEKGKELFEKRGCMGCHNMRDEYGDKGGVFAGDLSRVGEKVNFDYLVRWIYNPKLRLAPYSPAAKALPGRKGHGDILAADWKKAGKPAVFDREHTDCPLTGEQMVVENQTLMPRLRLTWEEARDVATFLLSKKSDKKYAPASFPLNPSAAQLAYGEKLVKHFGCVACHEIAGLEDEGPIGTELTKWGSKPIERLDFGLKTLEFKRNQGRTDTVDHYNHKGFALNKLKAPEFWDIGKDKSEFEKLRMPNFHLTDDERKKVVTFLLGSVDSRFPARFYHNPKGPAKWIQDGWWVVKKYNCMGCHQIQTGHTPRIQQLEWFSGEQIGDAPPMLVGQGFRTNPKWLAKFLRNPSLAQDGSKDYYGNGVRKYLNVRMPTFGLTDHEIQILVRFFAGLAKQPLPQVEARIDPLDAKGAAAAKIAFEKQVCLKCHVTDGPLTPQVIAPSFVISGERLNPLWMKRWLIDPAALIPGTKMPSGLFARRNGHWEFAGDPSRLPQELRDWKGDHVDLLVRYMRQYNTINDTKQN